VGGCLPYRINGDVMKSCPGCLVDYPPRYLNPMFVGKGYTPPICGVCALALTNQIHGSTSKTFTGEMSEAMRLDALAHRSKTRQVASAFKERW
jgi:hypothetical protein